MAIPDVLRSLDQWVLWKTITRDGKPTKVPCQPNGKEAKSSDSTTWITYAAANERLQAGGYDGIGFVFAKDGGIVGIDLDGCYDASAAPGSRLQEWAKDIVLACNTYTELSPSGTGVKMFCFGDWPLSGKNKKISDVPVVPGKEAGIEVYSQLRYFAVTGQKLGGMPDTLEHRQPAIDAIRKQFWPEQEATFATAQNWYAVPSVVERARKYLSRLPPSISGQAGHNAAFHAACVLVLGFGLDRAAAMSLMGEWNQTCQPPWSERDLLHKIDSAAKQPGERNYLRNVQPARWESVYIPHYASKPQSPTSHQRNKSDVRVTTLAQAADAYIERLKSGKEVLIETGLPDVDYAIGGGVSPGEMVLMCARPSHGKSAVALQCAHVWTGQGRPVLMISEEMSTLTLGKRTLQFISEEPEEHWRTRIGSLERESSEYKQDRAPGIVIDQCGSLDMACEFIEEYVESHKIQAAIVDYAQILKGAGKTNLEKISDTSLRLKRICGKHNLILILLCQLSREIEKRTRFIPMMSDIGETGQLERDADVILFLVWPHRLDNSKPAQEYMIFVAKNRNRAIMAPSATVRFIPSRQMLLHEKPKYRPEAAGNQFDAFNRREAASEF